MDKIFLSFAIWYFFKCRQLICNCCHIPKWIRNLKRVFNLKHWSLMSHRPIRMQRLFENPTRAHLWLEFGLFRFAENTVVKIGFGVRLKGWVADLRKIIFWTCPIIAILSFLKLKLFNKIIKLINLIIFEII